MRSLPIPVPAGCDGMTVRTFVRSHLGLSARVLTKQKHHENGLLCNGRPCRSIDILHAGDVLTICIPEDAVVYDARDIPVALLYLSLYPSDAADEEDSVELGGRGVITQKTENDS